MHHTLLEIIFFIYGYLFIYKWFANKSSFIIVMKIILKVKYEKKKKYFL